MGDIADDIIEQGIDAIASGDACPECGFLIYDPPGCQCELEDLVNNMPDEFGG